MKITYFFACGFIAFETLVFSFDNAPTYRCEVEVAFSYHMENFVEKLSHVAHDSLGILGSWHSYIKAGSFRHCRSELF
jgi:hypothetical protein